MYNKSRLSKYQDLRQQVSTNSEPAEVESDRLSNYASRMESMTRQKATDKFDFRNENNYTPSRSNANNTGSYSRAMDSTGAYSRPKTAAEPDYERMVREQEDFLRKIDRSPLPSNNQPINNNQAPVVNNPAPQQFGYQTAQQPAQQPLGNGYSNPAPYMPQNNSATNYNQAPIAPAPSYQQGYTPYQANSFYSAPQPVNPAPVQPGYQGMPQTGSFTPVQPVETPVVPNYQNNVAQPSQTPLAQNYRNFVAQPSQTPVQPINNSYPTPAPAYQQPVPAPIAQESKAPSYQQTPVTPAPVVQQMPTNPTPTVQQVPVTPAPVVQQMPTNPTPTVQQVPVTPAPVVKQPTNIIPPSVQPAPIAAEPIMAQPVKVAPVVANEPVVKPVAVVQPAVAETPIMPSSIPAQPVIAAQVNTPTPTIVQTAKPVEVSVANVETEAGANFTTVPNLTAEEVKVEAAPVVPTPVSHVAEPVQLARPIEEDVPVFEDAETISVDVAPAQPVQPVTHDSQEIDDLAKVFDGSNAEVDNTFIDSIINDVKQQNIDNGIRSEMDTTANVFEAMNIKTNTPEEQVETKPVEAADSFFAIDEHPEHTVDDTPKDYTADEISDELSKMFNMESTPVVNRSTVISPFGIGEESKPVEAVKQPEETIPQTEPVEEQPQAVEPEPEPQPMVQPEEHPEIDALTGTHKIVFEDEPDDPDINHLSAKIESERALRQDMIEQTKQLKLKVSEYENEVTDMNSSMSRTNRVLNFVMTLLIITLFVIMIIIAYWFAQNRGLL